MSVLFGLLSALCYGTADFVGGVVSARIPAWTAAFCSQVGGTVATVAVSVFTASQITGASLAWGTASGLCTGVGLVMLYHGLSVGRMGVVAPLAGVTGAAIPALTGILSGDRPSGLVWVGLVLALPAVALVATVPNDPTAKAPGTSGAIYGFGAGAVFGVGFATIAQVPSSGGHWPVALSMAVGALVTAAIATVMKRQWRPQKAFDWTAGAGGMLGGLAVVFFVAAANRGLLSVASVLSSLYPAITVLLAVIFLRERVGKIQSLGLGLTGAAIAMVALG